MSDPFALSYVALWLLVGFQTLVLVGLVRTVYQLQSGGTAEGSRGREAPAFQGTTLNGAAFDSNELAGRVRAVLFVSPDCASCTLTLLELRALQARADGNLIVVCHSGAGECGRLAAEQELTVPVVADPDRRISGLYGVSSVPVAVLINADNRIEKVGQPEREKLEQVLDNGRPRTGEEVSA